MVGGLRVDGVGGLGLCSGCFRVDEMGGSKVDGVGGLEVDGVGGLEVDGVAKKMIEWVF